MCAFVCNSEGESEHIQMAFSRSQIRLKREIGKGEFGTVSTFHTCSSLLPHPIVITPALLRHYSLQVFHAEARKLVSGEKKTPVIVKVGVDIQKRPYVCWYVYLCKSKLLFYYLATEGKFKQTRAGELSEAS